jgi:uncharacterized protein (DUF488 family)
MSDSDPGSGRVLYTIGHSNHPLEMFLQLLRENGIETLVDTRSRPHSKYAPHFNKAALAHSVPAAGIRYEFLGRELGGRPGGAEFYDADGHVLYGRVAESAWFLDGIARLEQEADRSRAAIFCSEENPSECHRRLLVGRVLTERGNAVRHIRADGRVQPEEELRAEDAERKHAHGQQALFDEEEVAEWRSIRSVLPGRPPRSSSGF